jgi:hypothetical protein
MLRTASTPLNLSQTFEGITLNPPDIPLPTTIPQPPSVLRPKPRKPPMHNSPVQQLQVPHHKNTPPNSSRSSRRRAHSRISDSGG